MVLVRTLKKKIAIFFVKNCHFFCKKREAPANRDIIGQEIADLHNGTRSDEGPEILEISDVPNLWTAACALWIVYKIYSLMPSRIKILMLSIVTVYRGSKVVKLSKVSSHRDNTSIERILNCSIQMMVAYEMRQFLFLFFCNFWNCWCWTEVCILYPRLSIKAEDSTSGFLPVWCILHDLTGQMSVEWIVKKNIGVDC